MLPEVCGQVLERCAPDSIDPQVSSLFSFDEATHGYSVDGISVPSVTRTIDHAGLVSYDMVREEILLRKSEIGTKVHRACHFFDDGDLDIESLDYRIRGYVEAWIKFRNETGFCPYPGRIEARFVVTINGMTVGLTVDRVGLFRKQETVVEIKTAAVAQRWWSVQLAGYALGVPDHDGLKCSPMTLFHRRRRIAVQLFADGDYRKHNYEDTRDASVFISALHVTHWKMANGSKLRRIEE